MILYEHVNIFVVGKHITGHYQAQEHMQGQETYRARFSGSKNT
jgi:hypothetical protein